MWFSLLILSFSIDSDVINGKRCWLMSFKWIVVTASLQKLVSESYRADVAANKSLIDVKMQSTGWNPYK
jgi:hypothetical protein